MRSSGDGTLILEKNPDNGFLGCSNLPALMDAFEMFEPKEDPTAKKRRKKKEKAARQKAAQEAKAEQGALNRTSNDGPWPFYDVCMLFCAIDKERHSILVEKKMSNYGFSIAVETLLSNYGPGHAARCLSDLRAVLLAGIDKRFDEVKAVFKKMKITPSSSSFGCRQFRIKLLMLLTVLRETGGASKNPAYGAFIRLLMIGNADKECFTCGKPATQSGTRCHGCHAACFCDQVCQKKGWQAHAADCKVCQRTIADDDAVNSLKM